MEITMGYRKALVLLPVFLISNLATAGKWSLTPSVKISESYTDNLLHAQADKKSTLITELTPSLKLQRQGKYLDTDLTYRLSSVSYHADSDLNDTTDYFKGDLNFKLFDNRWLIKLSADKKRALNSLADGVNTQNNFITPSQTTTTTYSIDSYFNSRIPDVLLYNIGFKANKVLGQSHNQFNNKKSFSSSINLKNTNQQKKSYWNLSVNRDQIKEDEASDFEQQIFSQYNASMGINFIEDYWLFLQYSEQDNELGANSSGNIESSSYGLGLRWFPSNNMDLKISYNKSLDDINDDFTSVELTIKPSNRTQSYLSTGKRFYGDYYDILFKYRLKRFSTTLTYHEEISSYNISLFKSTPAGSLICPSDNDFNPNECYFSSSLNPTLEPGQQFFDFNVLSPEESQRTTLDKRLSSTITYTKRRVNLVANFTRSIKSDLETQNERHDSTIIITAGYRLNQRSNISLTLSYLDSTSEKNQPTQSKAKDQTLSVSYTRKLAKDAIGLISFSRFHRNASGSLNSYDENRILISLDKEF